MLTIGVMDFLNEALYLLGFLPAQDRSAERGAMHNPIIVQTNMFFER